MKKRVLSAMLVAAMAMTAIPSQTFAEGALDAAQQTGKLSYDGYKQVWGDEFDGDSLNRDDWNVETHEKGWVNNELQEYVDSDENIQVKDGKLVINPVEKVETTASGGESENMIPNDAFGDASNDGVITKEVTNATMGSNPWDIQIIQNGIKIEEGETYEVSFKASSTKPRKIVAGVQKTSADYDQYGQGTFDITTESVEYKYEVNGTVTDENAGVYFNLGKSDQTPETPESTIKISDIKMVKKSISGTKVKKSYTSGRISTQNKQTFTYGRFECRAKVSKGQGYLPAFWLMANDENVYGQWPRCGEIDCMEVMGQETNKAYGTIHYGNPHSESQGTYTIKDGADFSDAFHTFTCDWEPGKITWYVDGVKYHEESDWYSTTVGQGTLTYPAPFDQPFYIILNLAVGGSWVGNPNDETSFENNPYEIDYVRVYQKDSYDEDVKRPVKEVTLRDPDATGNYINNGDFSVKEDLSDDTDWKFLTALEGEAEASIDNNTMTVKTTNEGTVDYSVQLVQADLPFEKGATYQVQFDAYASADREMGVDIKAPDHGYMSYMPHQDAQLTTEKQTYTYTFKMGDASDANGRLEYNMGAKGFTADIYISNVSVKKIKEADPNEKEEKTVLANGNYVYNGSFQEGDKHLGYWNISNAENADVTVTPFSDGRRLKVTMSGNEKSAVVISQEDLAFATGTPYKFSFTASSDADNTITANIGGHVYTFDIKAGETKDFAVELPSDAEYVNHDISITLGMQGKTWIDNVSLVENALIKNGSFNDGTTGYTVYIDSSAKASYVVDSLKDDNALAVTINDTGDQDWKVQIKQENIKLEKGKTYKLKFKAKSSLNRQIRVVMQGQENRGWSVYSNDNIVDLTNEYQTFEDTFTMNEDTDTAAFFSACLGKIGDNRITTQHEVRIDDISLEEVKDDPKEDIKDNPKDDPKDDPKEDIKDNPKDDPKQDIKTDIKNEQPKVPAPVIKTSDSDKVKTTQAVKESKTAKAAKTGDNSPIMAYVFGAMAGALILGVSFLKKKEY
ncbi:MAG: carbohydrate binding domain-containing protein [Agathobacter sp.]|uniref:carbohydrate binding domain-containing protein n=1 Tax=Agathobacter sp. TaxID=2021311 RepID=UPI002E77899A|nr:carbohydrate binding domain-containing protein [Agathobacter sp.]MEE1217530.1 carbohydrate binding domain-containing protein [Agathobacter sp.]